MQSSKIAGEVYQMGKISAFSENDIHEAIKQLRPGCTFDLTINGGIYNFHSFWHPENLLAPTQNEIENQLKYQEDCKDYYQYAYNRCHEYPDGFEQLDMLWHAVNNEENLKESEWFLTIKAVKEKHPKPNREAPIKKE